jgi:DnaJ-class molecular chaperone
MIRLTCRLCKGTGVIPNVAYEACRTMQSQEAKRYFYINQEHNAEEANEKGDGCAVHEKTVTCPQCDGNGVLEFDEEDWELSVMPEEDEEG